jgi:exosortase
VGVFAAPLSSLVRQSLSQGYSSHIVLIPLLAGFLIWSGRETIFVDTCYSLSRASQIGAFGIVTAVIAYAAGSQGGVGLAHLLTVLSVLQLIVAGFVGFFGTAAFRKAVFPFSLLLMVVPIPSLLVDRVIQFLQAGSADLTAWTFSLLNVPVLREGFVLTVPGVSIEIAKECSGINSSIALLIIMLLVAHETLHSNWRRIALVLVVIPLSIVKNAIRIVTLTILATHVDPSFLTGKLHHEGGFVFYLISLAFVFPIWKILQKTEKPRSIPSTPQEILSTP